MENLEVSGYSHRRNLMKLTMILRIGVVPLILEGQSREVLAEGSW